MAATRAAGHSDVAVTIDTGESKNIHPVRKEPVGRRLALLALADVYGERVVARGPVFRASATAGDTLTVTFDHADGGLTTSDGRPPDGFAVAGVDRVWHAAGASVVGNTVVVRSDAVPAPVAVRYAWADHPTRLNLTNHAGLPAAPFRTDDWPAKPTGAR